MNEQPKPSLIIQQLPTSCIHSKGCVPDERAWLCCTCMYLSSPDSPDSLDFLSPPSDFLQLKCPICLELLLESPIFFTCCGNHVCGSCIKNSTKDHVPYVKHYIYTTRYAIKVTREQ